MATAAPPPGRTEPATPAPSDRAGILLSAVVRWGRQRFSGTLRLDGTPGGTVTMRDGLVVAAATPVAPGPEPLLLRSGRISEADWSAAFTAGAPDGRLAAELVERGLLGTAGLEVVTQTAVFDAVFAMALCGVRTCTAEPTGTPPPLPAEPGVDAERLVRETTRRLATTETWQSFGLTVHGRARALPAGASATPVGAARRAVLDRANGRRTPRDIAFALGRGLYSVMTDLATLVGDGLAIIDERPAPSTAATAARTPGTARTAATGPATASTTRTPAAGTTGPATAGTTGTPAGGAAPTQPRYATPPVHEGPDGLPQRRRGAAGS
ncbi:hypothetical protein [Actinomadura fibrosa]|uniref:MarR family transcriptional regulator n=1 Tax=Actinomadura fibrosa TaxID=111802 RepID=A0ABW2XKU3_9ACTN|nr:hypothetical protein [Actinomadura fibrosa]